LHDDELLGHSARRRGAVMTGGLADWQKAAEIVLADFRGAAIVRSTLETPPGDEQWLAAGSAKDAEREARRKAQREERKGSR